MKTLPNMFPCFSDNRASYCGASNAVLLGQSCYCAPNIWFVGFADFSNLFFRENCGVLLASSFPTVWVVIESVSAFIGHILDVIRVASKEKMGRIYAGRIVAFVTNTQSCSGFNDIAVCNFPRKTMGLINSIIYSHVAVSRRRFSGYPNPASIFGFRFFNPIPKSPSNSDFSHFGIIV